MTALGAAYSAGAAAWADGPTRVYGRLADLLVAFSPVPLHGRLVLDLGSGTGVGSRAATAAGARVVAADVALGMLLNDQAARPPAAVTDIVALGFRDAAFDVVLAPFSLNHLDDPAPGVREVSRVGDVLVASTYASDDRHPAREAVDAALSEAGWQRPAWYDALKASMAAWGDVDAATAAVERGGMQPLVVERHEVAFPELAPADMVAWRLGLAQCAPFLAGLGPDEQRGVAERARALLGDDPPPIVRRVIFLAARARQRPSAANVAPT